MQYELCTSLESSPETNPLIARIDTKAGHGAGCPTQKVVSIFYWASCFERDDQSQLGCSHKVSLCLRMQLCAYSSANSNRVVNISSSFVNCAEETKCVLVAD